MIKIVRFYCAVLLSAALCCSLAQAKTISAETQSALALEKSIPSVSKAYAVATLPGQPVGAAYFTLHNTDKKRTWRLIGVRSPQAGAVQIHQMSMQKGVMRMRALHSLYLPPNKTIVLEAGGLHLMLFDLAEGGLVAGKNMELVLTWQQAEQKIQQTLTLPIRAALSE